MDSIGQTTFDIGIHTEEDKERYYEAGWWDEKTVENYFQERTDEFGSRDTIYTDNETLTYEDFEKRTRTIGHGLREAGIEPREVVALQLPNIPEYMYLLLAIQRIGAIPMGLSMSLGREETQGILRKSGASGIVVPKKGEYDTERDFYATARSFKDELPQLESIVTFDDTDYDDVISYERLREDTGGSASPDRLREHELGPDEPSIIFTTSGTTGVPKCIMHSTNTYTTAMKAIVRNSGLNMTDNVLGIGPYSAGATGPGLGILAPFIAGSRWTFLPSPYDEEDIFRAVEDHGVTVIGGVPTQIYDLVTHPNLDEYDLTSLRLFINAGAPLEPNIANQLLDMDVLPINAYGSSESWQLCAHSNQDMPSKIRTTAGKIHEHNEAKILDEDLNEVSQGEVGEIWFTGAGQGLGYLGEPEKTREVFSHEGGELTSDIGRIDDDGYLEILGRKSDMILRGGMNIYPSVIEGYIQEMDAVTEVSIVGMPDERLGERACAYIVPRSGADINLSDIQDHLDETASIDVHKYPERVEVIDEIPRSAGGKVKRTVLKEDIEQKLVEEGAITEDSLE